MIALNSFIQYQTFICVFFFGTRSFSKIKLSFLTTKNKLNTTTRKLHDNKTTILFFCRQENKKENFCIFFWGFYSSISIVKHNNATAKNNKYDTYLLIENFYVLVQWKILFFYDEKLKS